MAMPRSKRFIGSSLNAADETLTMLSVAQRHKHLSSRVAWSGINVACALAFMRSGIPAHDWGSLHAQSPHGPAFSGP
jgi:hypothetical protein